MSSKEYPMLLEPESYVPIDEPEYYQTAFTYVIIKCGLPNDSAKWIERIIYVGQCAGMTPKGRWQMHQNKRKEEMKEAKPLIVKEHTGPTAEEDSLIWEFLLFAHKNKMKLLDGCEPGNWSKERGRCTARAEQKAMKATRDLQLQVVDSLSEALFNEKNGMTKENDFSFQCDKCDQKCSSASGLKQHKKVHTEEEPQFQCEQCDKKFFRKKCLNAHIREQHLQQKRKKQKSTPRICPLCGHQSGQRDDLKKHLMAKRKHGLEEADAEKLLDEVFGPKPIKRTQKRKSFFGKYGMTEEEMEEFPELAKKAKMDYDGILSSNEENDETEEADTNDDDSICFLGDVAGTSKP